MNELKTFWKLTCDGHGWYIDTAEGMAEFVRVEMTEGEPGGSKYTLESVQMTQEQVDALPEFNGF